MEEHKLKNLISRMISECRIAGEITNSQIARYLVATDGSIYQREPHCVVYPKNSRDVASIVGFARENGLTVHARGSGSGLCGSALGSGIVIDFSKFMNRLLNLDLEQCWFECEPGYRFGELEIALKGSGLFFPPDPSSGEYASFGGMYATNASGAHSVKYGNVSDYILDAEVQFADGSCRLLSEIEQTPLTALPPHLARLVKLYQEHGAAIEAAYPAIKCNVAGYNLRDLANGERLTLYRLFAGAEGTLGIVTRLRFRLQEKPAFDSMVVAFFDTIINSARAAQLVIPYQPSGIEIMDKSLLNLAKENDPQLRAKIPDGIDNVLLIEFDSFTEEPARKAAETVKEMLEQAGLTQQAHLAASEEEKAKFWAVRKAAVPILYKLKGEKKILALIEDAAIPIDGLVDYFKGIYQILNRHNLRFVVYGHIAKGLMHTRPLLNLKDPGDIALLKVLADEVYELVTGLNGTVSGEHGDGRIRSAYVQRRYPIIYPLFLEVKQALDPQAIFNPEIITNTDSNLIHSHLRYGERYRSKDLPQKQLLWEEGWSDQVETCHGCSKCTTVTTATRMCPIYKFTREEAASPKAKANVLRALLSGAVEDQALYRKELQDIIEHCVNCGSCYQECPSNVNIPKLALEAKAQYVNRYGSTLHNKVVSHIETAARLSWRFSYLAQPLLNLSGTKRIVEHLAGVSAQRELVTFSAKPLRKRVDRQAGNGTTKVIYFAGCYASYIRPEIGQAAVSVLTRLGLTVITPEQHCCGLPMLSKGMVPAARKKIRQNLKAWSGLLDEVDQVVVTCSSCGLSLLQEWSYLEADPAVAKVRDKLVHITALVERKASHIQWQEIPVTIGYHLPCHLKVQPHSQASISLLKKLPGVTLRNLNSHCCGMAGSWGMAREHFELSRTIGSDLIGLLETSQAGIGVTDCPTCRMQMEQFGKTPILHPIEIVAERLPL